MDLKPRLYIHIGTHKTGSTVVQNSFSDSAAALQREGVIYLPIPSSFSCLKNLNEVDDDLNDRLKNELKTRTSGYSGSSKNRFFMSWEGFSGDVYSGYQNTDIVAESLKNIVSDFDCTIIIYLRRQDDFIESLYTQMIHQGYSYGFEEFINDMDISSYDWKKLVTCYEERFGRKNICLRRYHKRFLPEKDSIIKKFASLLKANNLQLSGRRKEAQNRGYSRDGLEIALLTNRYLGAPGKKVLRSFLQNTLSKEPFESYSFFSSQQRKDILKLYDESNRFLAVNYFNEPNGELFPTADTAHVDNSYPGLTHEKFAETLAAAITLVHKNSNEPIFTRLVKRVEFFLRQWARHFPQLETKLRSIKLYWAGLFKKDLPK